MDIAQGLFTPGDTQRVHSPEIGLPSQNACVGDLQPVQCLTQVGTVTGQLTAHHCTRDARVQSCGQLLGDRLETCGLPLPRTLGTVLTPRASRSDQCTLAARCRKDAHGRILSLSVDHAPNVTSQKKRGRNRSMTPKLA